MALRIATNVQSLAAQRSLDINNGMQNQQLERLSSGSRINHAGDDAAGLAISEKLKANIRSLRQNVRNSNDGISLVQVAEGSMSEIGNILIRLRELSIQSASDTISDNERGYIDKEVQQLKAEVDRISDTTQFNGTKLLDGKVPQLEIQVGLGNDAFQDRLVFDTPALATTLATLKLEGVNNTTKESSQMNLKTIDDAINQLNDNRSNLGALQNRLQSTINNLSLYKENLEAANSRIRDTDMAETSSDLVKQNILMNANVSVLGQANSNPQLALKLMQ